MEIVKFENGNKTCQEIYDFSKRKNVSEGNDYTSLERGAIHLADKEMGLLVSTGDMMREKFTGHPQLVLNQAGGHFRT